MSKSTGFVRVDFRIEQFLDLIQTKGMDLVWKKRLACPCLVEATGHPAKDCPQCYGTGSTYRGSYSLIGLVQGVSRETDPFQYAGQWIRGAAELTVDPKYKIGYYDRIIMDDALIPVEQYVERGSGATDQLRFEPMEIEYAIDTAQDYEAATDFEIDGHGIKWVGDAPDEGDLYSVRYLMRPTFIVIDHLHVTRLTRVAAKQTSDVVREMPLHLLIQLEFLRHEDANS